MLRDDFMLGDGESTAAKTADAFFVAMIAQGSFWIEQIGNFVFCILYLYGAT